MDIAQGTGSAAGTAAGGPAPRHRIDLQWLTIGLCVAVVVYLALMPLVFLLWQSFHTPQTATVPSVARFRTSAPPTRSGDTLRLFVELGAVRDRHRACSLSSSGPCSRG